MNNERKMMFSKKHHSQTPLLTKCSECDLFKGIPQTQELESAFISGHVHNVALLTYFTNQPMGQLVDNPYISPSVHM